MLNLLLAVFFSTAWFIIFRYFKTFKIDTFPAVVVNYWVCVMTGFLAFGWNDTLGKVNTANDWIIYACALGGLFISTFYLTAYSAQMIGVTLTSVSAKISLVLTVFANLFILQSASKIFDFFNYTGILLAIVAIILSSISPKSQESNTQKTIWWLPLLIFSLTATVDITVNTINKFFVKPEQSALFSILTFSSAACIGFLILGYQLLNQQRKLTYKEWLGGLALGVPNFFSLFYLLKALEDFKNDGAFLFPVFNIAVILASTFCAVILFKEKLSKLNIIGLLLAILSIVLIAYQELLK
jgi:drug/metabolite transporter (DMT)-like permease